MRPGVTVDLLPYELAMAEFVGKARQAASAHRPDAHGFSGENGEAVHVFGAQCEVAAAKVLGRYWPGSVNTFKDADLPPNIQVRGRVRPDAELILRDDDADDELFVLVTGEAPTFTVVGYTTGEHAKHPHWLRAPKGRPPAYFVPQYELLPIREMGR